MLRSPAEMAGRFPEQAVRAAAAVAERCRFDLTQDLGYRYPDFVSRRGSRRCRRCTASAATSSSGATPASTTCTRPGGGWRRSCDLIEHHGLAGFFLLHRDILETGREVAVDVRGQSAARRLLPPGPWPGSSVGSIVCYLIGLSHVDPVEARLFLGRFLAPELASVPDIDLDFPRDVREGLILRVQRRYGDDHAALVAAFPTYRVRGAIRDLGKALALPQREIERMARLTDVWDRWQGVARMHEAPDSPRWRALPLPDGRDLGLPRHISQHSGRDGDLLHARWSSSSRCCPLQWRAGASASGTRIRVTTPASSRSTCWDWGCCPPSRSASI